MISARLVTSIILFVVAGVLLLMAVLHFLEKGFLFHNAYIYASPEERKTMNKKPYYRQTAVVLSMDSAIFLILGLAVTTQKYWLEGLMIPLQFGVIIYAVISSRRIDGRT